LHEIDMQKLIFNVTKLSKWHPKI